MPPYWTVRLTLVEWVRLPLLPVIVRVNVPLGPPLIVFTVSTEDPEPFTTVGLKEAAARFGRPLTLKFTVPEKPCPPVMLTV